MINKFLQKRCDRCDHLFKLPAFREGSKAKMLAINFTPCPLCYYVKDIKNPNFDRTGRCIDCCIPFAMVKHKAKGRCHRCLMEYYRKNSTK